ncbi:MAG: ribonuclease J [Actinobacteria bacterium]|nr:MAG: ribonuclease J [Actinomycetota bacterium]
MSKRTSLKLIPLGGLGGIGKNMMVFEKDNQIIIVDCGIMFPDDDMPGIDFIIPDFSYVKKNKNKVKAIILTHGHEDHIGGLPFLFKEINAPVFATKLTIGLTKIKFDNSQKAIPIRYNEINPDKPLDIGPFHIDFFRVNHSIPDGLGLIIKTDIGTVVHTGDFKFDHVPIDNKVTQFSKIARAGQEGVLALLCDSTNAEEIGFTLPERDVGKTLLEKFEKASKRIIVATFSSHIHRIQQVLDVANKLEKKVAISGMSILKTVKISAKLGYLKIPEDTIVPITKIDQFPIKKIVILSTGSQGEPLSALNRMALGEHKRVRIMKGDMVIISASPIPGNERVISNTINRLIKQGADVFYESIAGVHVSGHAAQEEIKIMINLTNPKYFIPIHGEDKHKVQNARIAESMGIDGENIIIAEDGDIIKMNSNLCRVSNNLHPQTIYIDGVGMGNIKDMVLRDRKILSRNGIIFIVVGIDYVRRRILCEPDFILKGIIYIENLTEILDDSKKIIKNSIQTCFNNNMANKTMIEDFINDRLEKFIFKKARIRPIIITKVISPDKH